MQRRPEGTADDAPLLLPMTLGGLRADLAADGSGNLVFTDPASGSPVLGYQGLKVWDADGKQLAAELRPGGDGFLIAINDGGARYPVSVDPLIISLEQRIDAGPRGDSYIFGEDVAIDGDSIAIAAPAYLQDFNTGSGAIYMFTRQSGVWTFQQFIRGHNPGNSQTFFARKVALEGDVLATTSVELHEVEIWGRQGGIWTYQATLTGSDTVAADYFGSALAMEGNTIAVGAQYDSPSGDYSGSVYVFEKEGNSWQETKLVPVDGLAGDFFGSSLSLSGGLLLVGAPGRDFSPTITDIGLAYLFTNQTGSWSQQRAFAAGAQAVASGQFGNVVALEGNTLAITAAKDAGSPLNGTVTVYSRSGDVWTLQQRLVPGDHTQGSGYGMALAIRGDLLVVGAETDATLSADGGAAYIYTRSGNVWTEGQKLLPVGIGENFRFGDSIAIDGGTLLIGRSGDSTISSLAGSAYLYQNDGTTWNFFQRIFPTSGGLADHFGLHLDVDGDSAVIGALDDDQDFGTSTGSAYIFKRRNGIWLLETKLYDPDGQTGDRFGVSVGISGGTVIVGADFDDENNIANRGSAQIFVRVSEGNWARQGNKWLLEAGASSNFGRAVAIDGNLAIVGAPNRNAGVGRAWILSRSGTTWSMETQLVPAPGSDAKAFGFSVAISGEAVAVGSPTLDWYVDASGGNQVDAGAVWTFRRTGAATWTSERVFLALDPWEGAALGFSVAMSGDRLLMGAPGCPPGWTGGVTNWTNRGKIFASHYGVGGWTAGTEVTAPETLLNNDYFGFAIGMEGDRAVISAPGRSTNTGKAFVYRNQGEVWIPQTDVIALSSASGHWYGASVAMSGNTVLIGAFGAGTLAGAEAGAAYVYRITDPDAAPPRLNIGRQGGNVVLTWPVGTGLALWQTPDLQTGTWSVIPGSQSVVTYSYPLSSGSRMFFRLADP